MMEDTIVIKITNKKAIKLLYDMEDLELIKLIRSDAKNTFPKLSEKYKNVFTKEDSKNFDKHVESMRKEWRSI